MRAKLDIGRGQNYDLHMHTWFCDGNDSPDTMVRAAIGKGLETVGISGHSFTPHDTSYCMSCEGTEDYIREIQELKETYADKIKVLLGIEMDYYADTPSEPYDYAIGSLHYLFKGDDWTDVDDTPYKLKAFADRHFDGDMLCLAELYYETVGGIFSKTCCDIIGHFNLITKFNERFVIAPDGQVVDLRREEKPAGAEKLLDTSDPRYIAAWKGAIDRIFADTEAAYREGWRNRLFDSEDKPVFELNTGAISRGYRTAPYPATDQIEYIRSRGGRLILTSDSHSEKNICFAFEEYRDLL